MSLRPVSKQAESMLFTLCLMNPSVSYATSALSLNKTTSIEERLIEKFSRISLGYSRLENAKIELVFGERINEVVRLARMLKAMAILIPHFRQSAFSKWIHGDLNDRIKSLAPCPVVFLDSVDSQASVERKNYRAYWDKRSPAIKSKAVGMKE